jgi:capsular polysaccharide biosynthesis protein
MFNFFCVRLYGSSFLSYEGYEYVIHNHSIIDPLTINWGYIGKKQTNHHGLSIYKYPKPKYLNGKTLLLSTIGATDCYGDWVLNLIPRIGFVEHFGFSLDQFDHILINPIKHNWQKELIEILNISHHNLIQVEPGQHYKCEEMIAPSYSPHSMFGYEYIKKRLCLSSLKQSKPRKKIFLTRKRNQWMRVINEDQLLPILQKHGFEVLDFNAMPLKQQIEIMLNTEFLISPEGSGLINSILLSADSKVIELFNKNKVNAMFHIFNLYNHNKYGALLCDEIKIIGLDKKSDIYVEPMQLDQLIQKLQD